MGSCGFCSPKSSMKSQFICKIYIIVAGDQKREKYQLWSTRSGGYRMSQCDVHYYVSIYMYNHTCGPVLMSVTMTVYEDSIANIKNKLLY